MKIAPNTCEIDYVLYSPGKDQREHWCMNCNKAVHYPFYVHDLKTGDQYIIGGECSGYIAGLTPVDIAWRRDRAFDRWKTDGKRAPPMDVAMADELRARAEDGKPRRMRSSPKLGRVLRLTTEGEIVDVYTRFRCGTKVAIDGRDGVVFSSNADWMSVHFEDQTRSLYRRVPGPKTLASGPILCDEGAPNESIAEDNDTAEAAWCRPPKDLRVKGPTAVYQRRVIGREIVWRGCCGEPLVEYHP